METNYISRQEHDEFARRMDAENQRLEEEDKRQNRRITELEEKVKEIHSLALAMERMSANIEKMAEAIERQGNLIEKQNDRLDVMEKEPVGQWNGIKKKAIETAVTVIVTALTIGAVALIAQYIK